MADKFTELEKELQRVKELNTTISKALAEEMASNFNLEHIRCIQEQKLDRIEAEISQPYSKDQQLRNIRVILQEDFKIDPALKAKLDAKKKIQEEN